MSRSLAEARITTRNARAALNAGLHWRSIDPDVHLGYRKGVRGGKWVVRWYGGDQKYQQATIGTADDVIQTGTLSFDEAVKVAREAVVSARRSEKAAAAGPIATVGSAVEKYICMKDDRARTRAGYVVRSDSSQRLGRHVLKNSQFCNIKLHELADEDIYKWRKTLDPKLSASSVQRLVNDLRASLNAAHHENRKSLPADFEQTVKMGFRAEYSQLANDTTVRENQILSDDQVRHLISTALKLDVDGDLARLIVLMAATGARFSQLARMCVGDVQVEKSRLMVPNSFKGKNPKPGQTPIKVGSDVIAQLTPIIEGRSASDLLLYHWRHVETAPKVWVRAAYVPWKTPSAMTRRWNEILEAAGLPKVVPYALRHSSIVRNIRQGLPMRLVASLHNTSTDMIEKNYTRWITDGLEELTVKAIVPLLPEGTD